MYMYRVYKLSLYQLFCVRVYYTRVKTFRKIVGKTVPKSRETSAVYMQQDRDEGMQQIQ